MIKVNFRQKRENVKTKNQINFLRKKQYQLIQKILFSHDEYKKEKYKDIYLQISI